jgi:hypothetical protein
VTSQIEHGDDVMSTGCFSFDCKLDLYVLDGNMTGQKYRDNVLAPRVVPHFDNHALADRPMFMDDNARPHRSRIIQHFLQQEAVQTITWPAMSPDMNPIEHVWDFIGRKINQRDYAWSEHIVTVYLACQIIIKNVQVQLTVKGKTTPDSYTPTPKSSCAQNVVVLK